MTFLLECHMWERIYFLLCKQYSNPPPTAIKYSPYHHYPVLQHQNFVTFSTWSVFGLAILSWKAGLGEKFRVLIIIVTVVQIVTLMQFVNYSNGPFLREVYSNQHTRDWFWARFIQIILGFPNFPDSFS